MCVYYVYYRSYTFPEQSHSTDNNLQTAAAVDTHALLCADVVRNLKSVNSKLILRTDVLNTSYEIGLGRVLENPNALQWCHNGLDGVSNHQPHHCLLNGSFRRSSDRHQSSASLAFVRGIHRWPVNSP